MYRPLFLIVLFILFSTSCDTEDILNDPAGLIGTIDGEASFTAKVNGNDFSSIPLLVVAPVSASDPTDGLSAAGFEFTASDSLSVQIFTFSPDPDDFVAGAQFNSSNGILGKYCLGIVAYTFDGGEYEAGSALEPPLPATCTISAIDTIEGTWSGTFSFIAEDPDDGVEYIVTEGEFTNVEY